MQYSVCTPIPLAYILYPDASQEYIMGARLTQVGGVEQVLSTFSSKFKEAQLKNLIGELELLVASEACQLHPIFIKAKVTSDDGNSRSNLSS